MPFFKSLVRITRDFTRDASRSIQESLDAIAFNYSVRREARIQTHRHFVSYARSGRPLTFREKIEIIRHHRHNARARIHNRQFSSNSFCTRYMTKICDKGYKYQRAPGSRKRLTVPVLGYVAKRTFGGVFEHADGSYLGRRLYATMAMPAQGIHQLQQKAFGARMSIVEVTSRLRSREMDLSMFATQLRHRFSLPVEVESVAAEKPLFESSSWVACVEPTPTGTFVDFNFAPQFFLNTQQLTTDSIDQLERDLQDFVQEARVLLKDIKTVSASLGELPVSVSNNNVRVHFPNADADKVNIMLQDIGVTRGVIHEEESSDSDLDMSGELLVETNWSDFIRGYGMQPAERAPSVGVSDLLSSPPSLSESPSSASSYSLSNESSPENTHMDSSVEIV